MKEIEEFVQYWSAGHKPAASEQSDGNVLYNAYMAALRELESSRARTAAFLVPENTGKGWHDLKIKGGSRYCAHLHYSEILQGHAQASVIRIKPHDIARPFAAFLHFELHDVFSFCEVYGHAHFDETRWYGNLRYRYAA